MSASATETAARYRNGASSQNPAGWNADQTATAAKKSAGGAGTAGANSGEPAMVGARDPLADLDDEVPVEF